MEITVARPLKIIEPEQFDTICDAPIGVGGRRLADQVGLSSGLIAIVKKECGDPAARARRLGVNPESILQAIRTVTEPATTALTIHQTPTVNAITTGQPVARARGGKRSPATNPTTERHAVIEGYGDSVDDDADYDFSDSNSSTGFGTYYLQNFGFPNPQIQSNQNMPIGSKLARLPELYLRMLENELYYKSISDFSRSLAPTYTPPIVTQEQSSNAPSAANHTPAVEDELLDELKKVVEEPTEREVNKDDSMEEAGSCTCPSDKRDTREASDQKGTINTDSPIGTKVEDLNLSKPENAITGQSSDAISITDPEPLSGPAKPKVPAESTAEGNILTKESGASENVSLSTQNPPPSPPSVSEVATPGANNQLDLLTTSTAEGTQEKLEAALGGDVPKQDSSSSTQQNQDQQNVIGIHTVTGQSPPAETRPPVTSQLGSPILPPESPGCKVPLEPAHSGETSSLVSNPESLDVVKQQETMCTLDNPTLSVQPSQTVTEHENETGLQNTTSTEPNGLAADSQGNQNDNLILAVSVFAAVALATEPLWRPTVEAVLKSIFVKLAPNRPTSETTPSTVQEPATLYSIPIPRRDNVF